MKYKIYMTFVALCYCATSIAMEVPEECFPGICQMCGAVEKYLCNLTIDAYIMLLKSTRVKRNNRDHDYYRYGVDGERYPANLMLAIQSYDNLKVEELIWGESIQKTRFSPEELTEFLPSHNESPLLCAIRLMKENRSASRCASLLVKATGPKESLCHIVNVAPKGCRNDFLKRVLQFVTNDELKKYSQEGWYQHLKLLNLAS